ncbi:MAG: hypothetical protein HYY02_02905 [Chloroflexi bacterium]|nr:hypothetical protein [Chloroflexota bacterium]
MRLLRNIAMGLVILVFTVLAILVVTHEGRVAIKTLLLLPEVLPAVPLRPLSALSTPPLQEEARYPYTGGEAGGTLFRPTDGGRHGAVILLLGVNPNLDDETLLRVANGLARQGIVVLLPRPAQLLQGRISYQEVEALIGGFRFLQEQRFVDPKRIGFAGFCVGSSLALIAAGDARISGDVRFVNFFGGYYSAQDLLAAMTTRRIALDGDSAPWEPSQDALIWFYQQLIYSVPSEAEQKLLERIFVAGYQPAPGEVAGLSPQARSVYQLLSNRDPARTEELYEALPEGLKNLLARLSPSNALEWIQTKVYIMHDRQDTYIPYVESRRLLAALEDYPRKRYTEFELFQHMHPQRPLETWDFLREAAKLYYHLYLLMLEVA